MSQDQHQYLTRDQLAWLTPRYRHLMMRFRYQGLNFLILVRQPFRLYI